MGKSDVWATVELSGQLSYPPKEIADIAMKEASIMRTSGHEEAAKAYESLAKDIQKQQYKVKA